MKRQDFSIDLQSQAAPVAVDVDDHDTCSIQIDSPTGTFSSGVITVRKTNRLGLSVNFGTPLTISAPGYVELTGADWKMAGYLLLEVTTVATVPLVVQGTVVLKRLV